MSDIERMSAMRVEKQDDNTKVSVLDLLRAVANDVESGDIEASSVVIIAAHLPETTGEMWRFNTYRAGVTRSKEVMILDLAHHKAMRDMVE